MIQLFYIRVYRKTNDEFVSVGRTFFTPPEQFETESELNIFKKGYEDAWNTAAPNTYEFQYEIKES